MLSKIFALFQNPRIRRVSLLAAAACIMLSTVGSVIVLGAVGLLISVPILALSSAGFMLALSAVRITGDPSVPPVIGWRSGWFDLEYGHLAGADSRNLMMGRAWQDKEEVAVDSTLDAQVAALRTEIQYLREAMRLRTDDPV